MLRRLPHLLSLLALGVAAFAHPADAMTRTPDGRLDCGQGMAWVRGLVRFGEGSVDPGEACISKKGLPVKLELHAVPAKGWTFDRWLGDCNQTDGDICVVGVTEIQNYTAYAYFAKSEPNRPPSAKIVDFGPNPAQAGEPAGFLGEGSDPEGGSVSYAWNFGDGSAASGQKAEHAYQTPGKYTVALTVTDPQGASATDTVVEEVTLPNQPPAASIDSVSPNPAKTSDKISFSGSGKDPEGGTLSYSWSFGDGGSASGSSATHTYSSAGDYTATLTVTDPLGATGVESATVTVKGGNKAPSASILSASPNPALVGQNVAFSGSGKDPEGGALTLAWDFGDGTGGSGTSPSHAYSVPGPYLVTLTVTDPLGADGTAAVTVNVSNPDNKPPTAKIVSADPNPAQAGQIVSFSGSGADPEGGALTYSWSFGDGTGATGQTAPHAYAAAGTYSVTLTVKDPQGATATASVSVTVNVSPHAPPTAAIVSVGPNPAQVGQSVTFSGSGRDPDGGAVSFAWRFGDGTVGSGQHVSHIYASPGTYGVTLTVTDSQGANGTAAVAVNVASGGGGGGGGDGGTGQPGQPVIGDIGQPQLPKLLPPALLTLLINTNGNGTVFSSGGLRALAAKGPKISCGARGYSCYAEFAPKNAVVLRAVARPGSVFVGWSGSCSGTKPTCLVSFSGDRTVTALFRTRKRVASALAAVERPRFRIRWSASIGKGQFIVRGRVTKPCVLRVQLRRPAGGPLVTEVVSVLPGRFKIAPKLAPGLLPPGANVLPGGFIVSLRGRTGSTQLPLELRTVELPAPPEGVVRRAFASSSEQGAPAPTLAAGAKEAWVHFVLAAQPKPSRAITVTWYLPGGKLLGTVGKSNRPTVESFVRSDAPLPSGFWRVELRAGGKLVKTLAVRIG
jgi:PKD repeat protein